MLFQAWKKFSFQRDSEGETVARPATAVLRWTELAAALAIGGVLLGFCCSTHVVVNRDLNFSGSMNCSAGTLNGKDSGTAAGEIKKFSWLFFTRVTPDGIVLTPYTEKQGILGIWVRSGFCYYRIPAELIKTRKPDGGALRFSRTDVVRKMQYNRRIPCLWLLGGLVFLGLLFDGLRRFSSVLPLPYRKAFRLFVAGNCFVILPLLCYWIFTLCGAWEYLRVIPRLEAREPLRLQIFYQTGRAAYSEMNSLRTGMLKWNGKINLICCLPRDAEWNSLRLDFDGADNTVVIHGIDIYDGFSRYTIPGGRIASLLKQKNDIVSLKTLKKKTEIVLRNARDAHIVFDPEKLRKEVRPHKQLPWVDIGAFFLAELFLIGLLYRFCVLHNKNGLPSGWRLAGQFVWRYLFLATLFLLLLTSAALLPSSVRRYCNMQQNILQGTKEGLAFRINGLYINNFGDIGYHSISYFLDPARPLQSALESRRVGLAVFSPLQSFQAYLAGRSQDQMQYFRYWNGNTAFLRFFDEFLTHKELRQFFAIILLALCTVFLFCVFRELGWYAAIACGLMTLCLPVYGLYLHMALYGPPVVMFLWASYILRKKTMRLADYALGFFSTGAWVVFLDHISYQLLALLIPGIIALLKLRQEEPEFGWKRMAVSFVTLNASWFMGYITLWMTKWLIAIALLPGAVQNIRNAISARVSSTDIHLQEIPRYAGIVANWQEFLNLNLPVLCLSGVLIAVMVILMVILMRRYHAGYSWPLALGLIGFAILPGVWQFLTANHAYIHFWGTCRIWSGGVLALLLLPWAPLDADSRRRFGEDLQSWLARRRISVFSFAMMLGGTAIVGAVVLTGVFLGKNCRYQAGIRVENLSEQSVIRQEDGLTARKLSPSGWLLSAAITRDWRPCSFEILPAADGKITVRFGSLGQNTAYGPVGCTAEYSAICINGRYHPVRLRHWWASEFPGIEIPVRANVPVRISCLVRIHPNWGNEN